jgi:hypothetical protein
MITLPQFIDRVLGQPPSAEPPNCWLHRAYSRGDGYLSGIDDALAIVAQSGELEALCARARKSHAKHSDQTDARFVDVLTEAVAFAWAAGRIRGTPRFTDDISKPDILSDGGIGCEAKSIHPPQDRRAESSYAGPMLATPSDGLLRKLRSDGAKAASQLSAADCREGLLFVNVVGLADLAEDISNRAIVANLAASAPALLATHPALTVIAIAWNFGWKAPFVVTRPVAFGSGPSAAGWVRQSGCRPASYEARGCTGV